MVRRANPPAPPKPIGRDHADIAAEYARGVMAGEVPVGRGVKGAVERHLKDLANTGSKFYFDAEKGAKVCRFVELLTHTKGRWAQQKQTIRLEPWQCFLIVVLFGWMRKSNDKRRFRTGYWEIPRKNGKSLLGAALGLYMFLADGEFGAEVFSGAGTEAQSWKVFGPARQMLINSPKLRSTFAVGVWAKSLTVEGKGSKFTTLIGNPGDGDSPSCAVIDEFHEADSPAQYDTMETGMGAREQPLMLVITTAGYNIAGPCHEKHDEVAKVLEGSIENDELFGVIFGCDPEDDWADPQTLIKANPNYGVSVDGDFLMSQQRQAMSNPIQQNKFKTKHLNIWTSVLAGVMNMQQWIACADPMLDEEELLGSDCWVAVDLASKSDLCSEQRLYRRMFHNRPHYYLFGRYWLPEDAIEEQGPNHAHYVKWVKRGLLTSTEGATVDFALITETVIEDCKKINPKEAIFDPYNAIQMMQAVASRKITAVEFVQTPFNFAVPLDELTTAVKDGRFHHDGNEITTWCISNMVARPSKKGMVSPVKQKPHQKIDGGIAAVMAIGRACANPAPLPKHDVFFV